MKNLKSIIVILFGVGLFAFECGDVEDCCVMPPCSDKQSLKGTWRLSGYRNASTGALESDPDPRGKGVVFTFNDNEKAGSIEGHTLVNTISGTYEIMENCRIKISAFGGTKVGEPAWSNRAWLVSDSIYHYQRINDNLTIYRNNGSEAMIFDKQ